MTETAKGEIHKFHDWRHFKEQEQYGMYINLAERIEKLEDICQKLLKIIDRNNKLDGY